jgi:hypothetical protein
VGGGEVKGGSGVQKFKSSRGEKGLTQRARGTRGSLRRVGSRKAKEYERSEEFTTEFTEGTEMTLVHYD